MAEAGRGGGPGRKQPNIMVTGTPGTGKTSLCAELCRAAGGALRHVEVGALVKAKGLHEGFDEASQAYVLDEDRVCDELEDVLGAGGAVVDHHSCGWFPERWFDLVVVLRAETSALYERLVQRKYPQAKLDENIDCEIMQVCLEEAHESYRQDIVLELSSNTVEDQDANVERLKAWLESRQLGDGAGGGGGANGAAKRRRR